MTDEEFVAAITDDQKNQNEVERLFHQANIVMGKVQPISEEKIQTHEKILKLDALAVSHGFPDIKNLRLFRLKVLSHLHRDKLNLP